MKPEELTPCPQKSASGPYPELEQSSQSAPFHLVKINFNSLYLRLGFPRGLLLSGCQTKKRYNFLLSPMCATCHNHLILLYLITLSVFYKVINYEAPPYTMSPTSCYVLPLRSKYFPQHAATAGK
jgi:hypothetical protein